MAANPITFTEIEAYCRLMRVALTPWEAMTLVLIDGTVLARGLKPGGGSTVEVDAKDGAGVKALMKGMGAKKRG